MKFVPKFVIRDLVWLTVVAALILAWWEERQDYLHAQSQVEIAQRDLTRETLRNAQLDQVNRVLTEHLRRSQMGFRR